MNKRLPHVMFIALIVVLVAGCSDRLDMENAAFPLLVGLDLDKKNKLTIYSVSPVLNKSAKKKTNEIRVSAQTTRQSAERQGSHTAGVFQGRSIQIILVSKRILQQENWFQLTDVWFRDPKNPLTPRIIAYDGPLSEIMYLNPKDQPMLPLLLREMVDTKTTRSETIKTTLQDLHKQMREKGMTPSISETRVTDKEISISGTTLLDHKGKFVDSLNIRESILLHILQNDIKKTISLTLPIPGEMNNGPFHTDKLSLNIEKMKMKIKTSCDQDKFQFDMNINMRVGLSELLFTYDVRSQGEELERLITNQVQKQLESLIKKIQAEKIDPIGLGLYARAHEYSNFKKVEDQWGETLARADIRVSLKTTIAAMGTVK